MKGAKRFIFYFFSCLLSHLLAAVKLAGIPPVYAPVADGESWKETEHKYVEGYKEIKISHPEIKHNNISKACKGKGERYKAQAFAHLNEFIL